jgi:hypothetical protein
MVYAVNWKVNNGKNGYPYKPGEPTWENYHVRGYKEAIGTHTKKYDVKDMVIVCESGRYCIDGENCRHYLVEYRSKDGKNNRIDRDVCVFCKNEVV